MRDSCVSWSMLAVAGLAAGLSGALGESQAATGRADGPRGDLTGDGVVDLADLVVLMESLGGGEQMGGDLNDDGAVDREDVRVMLELMGSAADNEDVFVLLENNELIPPVGMSWMSGSAHHPVVSSSNPNPPGGPHNTTHSSSHPNHGTVASTTWPHTTAQSAAGFPPGGPAPHDTTVSNSWPSNHQKVYSNQWPQGIPPAHDATRSDGWPPNHTSIISPSWPGPGTHENSVSVRWPPNHSSGPSGQGTYPHAPLNSSSRPNHKVSTSATWPNNHRGEFSAGWPGHAGATSTTWPPNHLQVITATWDQEGHLQKTSQQIYPPNWHTKTWSDHMAGGTE